MYFIKNDIWNKNFARGVKTYSYKKNKARLLAQNWQSLLDSPVQHSWDWCAKWQNIFERIAKKYGLQKEFKENGIL